MFIYFAKRLLDSHRFLKQVEHQLCNEHSFDLLKKQSKRSVKCFE